MNALKLRAATFLCAIGLCAGVSAHAGLPAHVTIAQSSQSLTFVPIYIAQTLGYFKDEGLTVDIVLAGGGPKALTVLLSGGAEFSASVLPDGIMAHRRGRKEVRALASLVNGYTAPFILRADVAKKAGITADSPLEARIAALRGKRMGITTPGASSDLVLRYLLMKGGMKPDQDAQIVPLGGVDTMVAAVRAGSVDGCSCVPPVEIITARNGLAIQVLDPERDLHELDGINFGILYGTDTYNQAHPEVTRAMIRALTRATMLVAKDPGAAREATRPFFKQLDTDTFEKTWAEYLPIVPRDPEIYAEGYAKELAFEAKVLPASSSFPVPFDAVVDMSFVHDAKRDLKQ